MGISGIEDKNRSVILSEEYKQPKKKDTSDTTEEIEAKIIEVKLANKESINSNEKIKDMENAMNVLQKVKETMQNADKPDFNKLSSNRIFNLLD